MVHDDKSDQISENEIQPACSFSMLACCRSFFLSFSFFFLILSSFPVSAFYRPVCRGGKYSFRLSETRRTTTTRIVSRFIILSGYQKQPCRNHAYHSSRVIQSKDRLKGLNLNLTRNSMRCHPTVRGVFSDVRATLMLQEDVISARSSREKGFSRAPERSLTTRQCRSDLASDQKQNWIPSRKFASFRISEAKYF